MWVGSTKASKLFSGDRWHVEHFLQENHLEATSSARQQTIQLGSLFTQSKNVVMPIRQPSEPYFYIGIKNVENVTGDLIGNMHCVGHEIKTASYLVKNDHVLFGRLRPLKNKVYLAKDLPDNVICSKEFYVLVPNLQKVTPRVLKALLSSSMVLDQIAKFLSGATIPRIAYHDLASIKVPNIPIEKQEALEEALLVQDARRATAKTALHNLPSEMESVLTDYCEEGQSS